MKLTPEQIDRLYQFTRQHYVEYYDLQTELVDHLANAIEQQWIENPKISFEEALQNEFKKFGVFGFMNVVEERQKVLGKKYHKLIRIHFKEFFKIPKIIATVFAVYLVYLILKNVRFSDEVYNYAKAGILIFAVIVLIINLRKRNKKIKEGEKRWLFKEMIDSYGTSTFVFIFPFHLVPRLFYDVSSRVFDDSISLFIISVFMVLYSLFIYIVMRVIPEKAEEYLKQTYPEYEISK